MTLQDDLRERDDVATAFASALAEPLGEDITLSVGAASGSITHVLGEDQIRVVALTFTTADGDTGTIAIATRQEFAEALERAASDETLLSACGPALETAASTLATFASMEVDADAAHQSDVATLTEEIAEHDVVVYPIVQGDETEGALVIAWAGAGEAGNTGAGGNAADDLPVPEPPRVLADVEMGVTAELGRCQMTVRELLAITPGAVIDLDRAAGAPVDVLVNGTLIARGEVVIIEEEFGIRISEILGNGAPAH